MSVGVQIPGIHVPRWMWPPTCNSRAREAEAEHPQNKLAGVSSGLNSQILPQ